jgi:hypothetical protein
LRAAQLLLRSALAALEAERDTLAARVATLERERAQTAELSRRASPADAAPASPRAGWWSAAPRAASAAASEAAIAAVQHHLVTVTTDRDLLAADLYRCMVERGAAQRERDETLDALREASGALARLAADACVAAALEAREAPDAA